MKNNEHSDETPRSCIQSHPTTVYLLPFSVNLVPLVFTKPVAAGTLAEVVLETVVLDDIALDDTEVATPGLHCEYLHKSQ